MVPLNDTDTPASMIQHNATEICMVLNATAKTSNAAIKAKEIPAYVSPLIAIETPANMVPLNATATSTVTGNAT